MEKVQIYPLPPQLVQLLEEKHRSGGKLGLEGARIWTELMPSLLRTHYSFRALSSHPQLEEIAIDIAETLDRMQKTIEVPEKSQEFTADCFRVYALMDEYVKTRAQLDVTRLPAVNGLIHAIHAHLRGRLHLKLIDMYAQPARKKIDELVQLYRNAQDTLEEPTKQALLKGIDSMAEAFQQVKKGDPEGLKSCLVNLKNGATILEHLAAWKEDFEKSEASPVPVVGKYVRGMLSELRQNGNLAPETLHKWVEDEFWNLQERWAKSRHDLFMPRPQKDRVVERLDSLMVNLRDLDQMSPRVQEQLLNNLESQYESLSKMGFQVDELRKHPAGWLVDLFLATLSAGVPRYKLDEIIQEFQGTDYQIYSDFLHKYLQEQDRDYLLDALAHIESELDAFATASGDGVQL